jgi:hypothetical protein
MHRILQIETVTSNATFKTRLQSIDEIISHLAGMVSIRTQITASLASKSIMQMALVRLWTDFVNLSSGTVSDADKEYYEQLVELFECVKGSELSAIEAMALSDVITEMLKHTALNSDPKGHTSLTIKGFWDLPAFKQALTEATSQLLHDTFAHLCVLIRPEKEGDPSLIEQMETLVAEHLAEFGSTFEALVDEESVIDEAEEADEETEETGDGEEELAAPEASEAQETAGESEAGNPS